jgi:two-component system phosphate regulon response regulator PhoB
MVGMPDRNTNPERQRGIVLVVDDDLDSRFIFVAALEHHGYTVREATDGEFAIKAIELERPDVVILDFAMPKLSGPEVLTRLKADPATSGIPVIACSAVLLLTDVPRLRALGYADVLLKPVDPGALVAAVHRIQVSDSADSS